jgi:hypothetical protein
MLTQIASIGFYDYKDCKRQNTNTWTVAEAKARFSEVIDRAHLAIDYPTVSPRTSFASRRETVAPVS